MKTKRVHFTVEVVLDIPEDKMPDDVASLFFGDFLLHQNLSSHLIPHVDLIGYETTNVFIVDESSNEEELG